MKDDLAQKTANFIFKDVFGVDNPYSLEQLKEKFCKDIDLPKTTTCTVTGAQTWVYEATPEYRIISQDAQMKLAQENDFMREPRPLADIADVLKAWEEIKYMTGDKIVNSQEVINSDAITSSANIYESSLIISSKNILLSHNLINSNHLLASKGSNACNIGIRMFDSIYCSSSFETRWSNKISKSLYIVDSLDLYECMFCYGIRSKKYCIANMQFEKDEYMRIKQIVVEALLKRF